MMSSHRTPPVPHSSYRQFDPTIAAYSSTCIPASTGSTTTQTRSFVLGGTKVESIPSYAVRPGMTHRIGPTTTQSTPRGTPSPTQRGSPYTGAGLSDSQRQEAFLADLKKLAAFAATSQDNTAKESTSYLLIRRAEHVPVRKALFIPEAWSCFHSVLDQESNPTVLAHAYVLLLVCSGTYTSDAFARETITWVKDPHSTSCESLLQYRWNRTWSWNALEGHQDEAQKLCIDNLDRLLRPLILSVHAKDQRLSRLLLKPSARALEALQRLWTSGSELALAMLRCIPAARIEQASFQSLSFSSAFASYILHASSQPPLLSSSRLSWNRAIEVALELGLAPGKGDEVTKNSPLGVLLMQCIKEVCSAAACQCCYITPVSNGASFPSSAESSFSADPFDLMPDSPCLSLAATFLRCVSKLLDDPSRSEMAAEMWNRFPMMHVLCLHTMMFHSSADSSSVGSINGTHRPHSSLVQEAEYVFTRYWFDEKRVGKVIGLICAVPTASSSLFQSTLPLYLPPSNKEMLCDTGAQCAHLQWHKNGLNSTLQLNFPAGVSTSSLLPHSHSAHLIGFVIGLLKKYLLLGLDSSSVAPSSTSTCTIASSSTPVRVVQELRTSKLATTILEALVRVMNDLMPSNDHSTQIHTEQIQRTLLEYFLCSVPRAAKFKMLFDHAWKDSSTTVPSVVASETLFALGIRTLLVLADVVGTVLESNAATASPSYHPLDHTTSRDTSSTTNNTTLLVLREHLSMIVQDVRGVLETWRKFYPASLGSTRQLTLTEVYSDTVERLAPMTPPSKIYPIEMYGTILQSVESFLASQLMSQGGSLVTSTALPSGPLTPRAPSSSAAVPPLISSPSSSIGRARPFSSRSAVRSGAGTGFAGAMSPRAPSYSPPSSANSGGAGGGLTGMLQPLIPHTSHAANAGSGRGRSFKLASAAPLTTLEPINSAPRPSPPSGSPRAPAANIGASLAPLIATLGVAAVGMKVSPPIGVKKQHATSAPR